MEKKTISLERHLGSAIALWGALCSGAFAGFWAVLLQFGFFKSVGVFSLSGLISGGIVSRLVVRRYRKAGVAGLQDTGPRWGALAGLINAMLSTTAVLALIDSASDITIFDSILKEIVVVVAWGLVIGGMYGLLGGLLVGGICGLIFEAAVTKYWLNRFPSDR